MKIVLFLSLVLVPSLAFADRLGSINSNTHVALSTQVVTGGNTNYIQVRETLQAGATFHVAKGTIEGDASLLSDGLLTVKTSASGTPLWLEHTGAASASNYLDWYWVLKGGFGLGELFGQIRVTSADVTPGFSDSDMDFFIKRQGSTTNILRLANDVEGTGTGVGLVKDADLFFRGDTSLQERTQYSFESQWNDSTDATRKARIYQYVWDTDKRLAWTIEADGSNAIAALGGGDPNPGMTLYIEGPSTAYVPVVVTGPRNWDGPALQVLDGNSVVVGSITLGGLIGGRKLVLKSTFTAAPNIFEVLNQSDVVQASMTATGQLTVSTTTIFGSLTIGNQSNKPGTLTIKNASDDLVTIDNTDNGTIRLNATGPHGQSLSIQGRNPTTGDSGFVASAGFSVGVANSTKIMSFQNDTNGLKIKESLGEGLSIFFEPKSSTSYGLAIRGLASQVFPLMQLRGISSTSSDRTQAEIDTAFVDSTDSTRKSRLILRAFDTSGRDAFKTQADGTVAITAIGGANPISSVTFSVPITSNTYVGMVIKSTTNQLAPLLQTRDVNDIVTSSVSSRGDHYLGAGATIYFNSDGTLYKITRDGNNLKLWGGNTSGCVAIDAVGSGNFTPCISGFQDLGTDSLRWRNLKADNWTAANGSVQFPSINFVNNTGMGFWSPANSQVGLSLGNVRTIDWVHTSGTADKQTHFYSATNIQDRPAAVMLHGFSDTTDATRKGRVTWQVVDTSSRTFMQTDTDGTAPYTQFFGSTTFTSSVTINGPLIQAGTGGTSGQVLTSNGVNVAPTWQAAGGGFASLTATQTWSGANTYLSTSSFKGSVYVSSGTNGISGTIVLAGPITVSTNKITADSFVLLTRFGSSGTNGHLNYSNVVPGVSFDITSSAPLDTSTIKWLIVNQTP